ncbi:MAG TPA: DUF6351 family protein, partial [Burkholderiales bacterium]
MGIRRHIPFVLLTAIAAAPLSVAAHDDDDDLEIVTLSNRADLISGGDALVEVRVPRRASRVEIELNGDDITSAFQVVPGTRNLRGLVAGLVVGRNELSAKARGANKVRLTVTNHPGGGPVLSGPQIVPYFCATPTPQPATATSPATNQSGLSTFATGPECNIAAEQKLYYRSTQTAGGAGGCSLTLPDANNPPANPCFKPYTPGPAPADMATTLTGVPFIVRVERGTMNRGIYDIAVLFDPTKPWVDGTAPQAQWNGKILYQFGAATGQPRRQARSTSSWTSEMALTRGYLVAQNSMTDSSLNSNRVSMSETVMMMKEHVGDKYGPVKFTMGSGCSGGSINSNMNASIMPGNLDGITISCAYPDLETTGMEVGDCVLLAEAYVKMGWSDGGPAQAANNLKKTAINGHLDQNGCHAWYNSFGSNGKVGNYFARSVTSSAGAIGQSSTQTNNCQLLASQVYDPVNNPQGARCSAWDWAASIFGRTSNDLSLGDTTDQRARDTRDNVGIQYGLKALLSGAISAEEFVKLNEIIGGTDKDSNFSTARTVADRRALEIAYQAGIVLSGRQYAKTAVIDLRGWDDQGIHHQYRTFSIRERLDREYGDHDNQVIWRFSTGLLPPGTGPGSELTLEAFVTMDQWLTNLIADTSRRSIERKVRSAKPAGVVDFCIVPVSAENPTGREFNLALCESKVARYKVSASPRQVAGGALSENILKCRLKPLNSADYSPVVLSTEHLARLSAVFPDGVCDWDERGVEQERARAPRDYTDGPGGESLDKEPESHPGKGHGHHHGH